MKNGCQDFDEEGEEKRGETVLGSSEALTRPA
jgi:hypothetical protein